MRELVDRSAGYGEDVLLDKGGWSGGRMLELGAGGATEVFSDLGDVNTGDPCCSRSSSPRVPGVPRRPLRAYHFRPRGVVARRRRRPGPVGDNVLDLAELTTGLSDGLELAGVEKLDLLGFDAA